VVARADSGITSLADLKGKRVNIGNPGSGQRGTMEVVMQVLGWSKDDFALAAELKSAEQSRALCDNEVDAIVFTVGHPAASLKEATTSCESVLVPVDGPAIERLISATDYYRSATIPGGMYRGNADDVPTFGVGATIVASAQTSDEAVYQVVKAVFDNFAAFRRLHPAFAHLEKQQMVSDGLTAPLPPGAIRYYKEAGLLE
jgi:TRAP transporter TAXI family solute receptor